MGCIFSEEAEDWSMKKEARPGELGAGWLKKQGKTHGNWSKRFFVLTSNKVNI
jgi:hypothetical protein